MKKSILILGIVFFLAGCNKNAIEKPDNLIKEEVMINIFYDLTLLEAMRSQNPYAPQNQAIDIKTYIYKKYRIDSLQLAESNRYYVSQIEQYRKMYDEVHQRIESEKTAAEILLKKEGGTKLVAPVPDLPDAPQVQ